MATLDAAVQRALAPGFDSLELLTPAFLAAPTPAAPPARRAHIAVLDSSFNPPTLAHQAIASSSFPPPASVPGADSAQDPGEYTARLLLFSARNVDKSLKPGDATPLQRAEMMLLLARHLPSSHPPAADPPPPDPRAAPPDIGVGVLNSPTFAGKARILRAWLAAHRPGVDADLTFLIGTDTLARFFEPRYYADMGAELDAFFAACRVVCARRGGPAGRAVEDDVLARPGVQPWARAGRLRMVGTGHDGWEDVSSTAIRERVRDGRGLDGLCATEIEEYVSAHGLYRS